MLRPGLGSGLGLGFGLNEPGWWPVMLVTAPSRSDAASTSTRACTARLRRPPGLICGAGTPTPFMSDSSALPTAGAVPGGTGSRALAGMRSDCCTRRRRRVFSPEVFGSSCSSTRLRRRSSFRSIEFHRFLIALSVRPGKSLTISDQRVPSSATLRMIAASSSADHSDLFTSGLRWLCHRSRHCFPERPDICAPTALQRTLPPSAVIIATRRSSVASSSAFQMCFFQDTAPSEGVGQALPSVGDPLWLGIALLLALVAVSGGTVRQPSSPSVFSDTSIDRPIDSALN